MKDLMEKYYNVIYYCAYKILFYFSYRLINPFYWLGLKKWNNNYINRCILIDKKLLPDTSGKGTDSWISVMAITSVYRISLWIIAVVCIIGIQFSRIRTLLITVLESDFLFLLLWVVLGVLAINVLLEKYQNNRYNTKYSDKAVLSLRYIVPTVGLILMLLLYQFR